MNSCQAHALTGCDTVACCYGVGKGSALKVLKDGNSLSLLGVIDVPMESVIVQATRFMSACYGKYYMRKSMSAKHAGRCGHPKRVGPPRVPPKLCSLLLQVRHLKRM